MCPWIEAMRLRTLPVSTAGVVMGVALALKTGKFNLVPAIGCLLFAVMAQVASNFANEYYDYAGGLDKKGRSGPRRGVTEGDITPGAMRMAALSTILSAAWLGCVLVWFYGAWWMFLVGVVVILGAYGYSTGPYPLSRHGWGEVAVICFFGVVPVCLTYLLEGAVWENRVIWMSIGTGLMGANVLIVNNYRDIEDDAAVGKMTLAVRHGREAVLGIYLANGYLAALLGWQWWHGSPGLTIATGAYCLLHTLLFLRIRHLEGARLNPMLGMTAVLMLAYSIAFIIL